MLAFPLLSFFELVVYYALLQVAALVLENTFTSILDMAGVLLPFLKWFVGLSSSKGPKILNFLVRSPWSTIDIIGQVRLHISQVLLLDYGDFLNKHHVCSENI